MIMENQSVLIIEDSLYMRTLIKIALRDQPYDIIGEAGEGHLAIDLIFKLNPDVIILDNILPDMLGIEILELIRASELNVKIIMVSQMSLGELGERAKNLGVDAFVPKPFETEDLLRELVKLGA